VLSEKKKVCENVVREKAARRLHRIKPIYVYTGVGLDLDVKKQFSSEKN